GGAGSPVARRGAVAERSGGHRTGRRRDAPGRAPRRGTGRRDRRGACRRSAGAAHGRRRRDRRRGPSRGPAGRRPPAGRPPPVGRAMTDPVTPGAIVPQEGSITTAAGRERRTLVVVSHSTRPIRVSSHYPF